MGSIIYLIQAPLGPRATCDSRRSISFATTVWRYLQGCMQPNLLPKNGKTEDGRAGGEGVGLFIRAVALGHRQIIQIGQ